MEYHGGNLKFSFSISVRNKSNRETESIIFNVEMKLLLFGSAAAYSRCRGIISIKSAYSLRALESDDPRLSYFALIGASWIERVFEDGHPKTKSVQGVEAFTSIKPLHRHGIATYIMMSMISTMLGSLNI